MTRRSLYLSFLFVAVSRGLCSELYVNVLSEEPTTPSKKAVANSLSSDEQSQIRTIVYNRDFMYTNTSTPEKPGHRIVLVPKMITECYKKNKVETLELLAYIVQGGNPKDARAAQVYMTALVGDPAVAALESSLPLDGIDKTGESADRSSRIKFIEQAKKRARDAAKAVEN